MAKVKRSDDIRRVFEEMELYLIASMRRNLSRHEEFEKALGFKYEQWQRAKLRDLQRLRRENSAIINDFEPVINGVVEQSIKGAFTRAKESVINFFKEAFQKKLKDVPAPVVKVVKDMKDFGIAPPNDLKPIIDNLTGDELKERLEADPEALKLWKETPTPEEANFFQTDNRKLEELIKEAEDGLKEAQSSILRTMEDEYRKIIFETGIWHQTGTLTLDQAIDKATRDFLKRGITSITYKDGSKRNIADYAAMALRTARHRAMLTAEGEKRKQLGISTVLTSWHSTSCPLCIPWQRRVLIDDVFSGGKKDDGPYPLLSTAMDEGFLHPNCEHGMKTWYPGILPEPKPPDKEFNDRAEEWYKQGQKQRALEHAIRTQKRVVMGTVEPAAIRREKAKLAALHKAIRKHLQDNPQLRREPEREKVITLEGSKNEQNKDDRTGN